MYCIFVVLISWRGILVRRPPTWSQYCPCVRMKYNRTQASGRVMVRMGSCFPRRQETYARETAVDTAPVKVVINNNWFLYRIHILRMVLGRHKYPVKTQKCILWTYDQCSPSYRTSRWTLRIQAKATKLFLLRFLKMVCFEERYKAGDRWCQLAAYSTALELQMKKLGKQFFLTHQIRKPFHFREQADIIVLFL